MATTIQPQIRMKSYFTTSIPDAIDMARRELGPDALLLNTRQSPPEARHLGPIEVVFGDDTQSRVRQPMAIAPRAAGMSAIAGIGANPTSISISAAAGIEDLRQKVDRVCSLLSAGARPGRMKDLRPALIQQRLIQDALIEEGMTRTLAADVEECVNRRTSRHTANGSVHANPTQANSGRQALDIQAILDAASAELDDRFQVRPEIGAVTALVGPPGSGKTTTLVKLAIREGLLKNRRVRLISADAQRIAASEQLRIYAAILGVTFQSAESMAALAQSIESPGPNSLTLIDTPGLSPALLDGPGADLASFFASRQDIDTQLVLTACMRAGDLEKAADRFAAFRPSAMIFTKMDETEAYGSVLCEAARTGLPISFFCDGQLVPENIAPATRRRITESLVRHLPTILTSAA